MVKGKYIWRCGGVWLASSHYANIFQAGKVVGVFRPGPPYPRTGEKKKGIGALKKAGAEG